VRWGTLTEVIQAGVDAGLDEGEVNQAVWDDIKFGEIHYCMFKTLLED
jgi:hypothetical protein